MPVLLRQPLASTSLDAHGERLTRDELLTLFEALPEELVINDKHDLTLPSAAVARNLQFVELHAGEWAIVGDVTVHDAELLKQRGGFSMAWLAATYTTMPDRDPDIQVIFNPRLFDKDIALALVQLSDDQVNIVCRELKQKGLDPDPILIIQFVALAAVSGFLGKPASDAYDKLLRRLSRAKEDVRSPATRPPILQFVVPRHLNPYRADIIVEMLPEHIEHLRLGALSFQDAVDIASLVPFTEEAKKIVIRAVGDPPKWRLSRYEKASGLLVTI
jgi:hypothetical protein